jgi:DNA-binding MarR family transcriptional regulator
MVKPLDDLPGPLPIDHLGWRLWHAAETWKRAFEAGMLARGHAWYGEARGGIFRHIGAAGISQSDLAARAAITKQAVQQFLDQLEQDGVVTRVPDTQDRRSKRVLLTRKGKAALHEANDVKREVEAAFGRKIGTENLARLSSLLDQLAQ